MEKLTTDRDKNNEVKECRRLVQVSITDIEFRLRLNRIMDMLIIEMMNRKSLQNQEAEKEKLISQIGIAWRDHNKDQLIERLALITTDCLNNFRQCEKIKLLMDAENSDFGEISKAVDGLHGMMHPQKERPVNSG